MIKKDKTIDEVEKDFSKLDKDMMYLLHTYELEDVMVWLNMNVGDDLKTALFMAGVID